MTKTEIKMITDQKLTQIKPELIDDSKPATYCWNCKGQTGYGFGKEPTRHDKHWCSSECWKEFFNEVS
jgi:hypothetical protein